MRPKVGSQCLCESQDLHIFAQLLDICFHMLHKLTKPKALEQVSLFLPTDSFSLMQHMVWQSLGLSHSKTLKKFVNQ